MKRSRDTELPGLVRPATAAFILGVTSGRVCQLIHAGEWGSPVKIGRALYIHSDAFEKWLREKEGAEARQPEQEPVKGR